MRGVRGCCAIALLALACWGDDSGPAMPDEPAPEPGAGSPASAPAPQPAPAPAPEPVPRPAPEPGPAPAPPAPPEPEPAVPPPAGPTLGLDELAERIEQTPAIGVFTKLALKGDIDDLLEAIDRQHREGSGTLEKLRNRFEALALKIQTLLEPEEPELAAALARSSEEIWSLLADPEDFASLRR